MTSRFMIAALTAFGLSVSMMPQAEAFQRGEGCEIKQTQDGFVALRKGASVKTRLVHRLKPEFHRVFPDRRNNTWVRVFVGGFGDPDEQGVPMKERDVGSGYVKSSLIVWSSCSMAN
jgi:hypothetical protein